MISATPPSVTALPTFNSQSAGSIKGGGTVTANGAYSYTIPIIVPKGRGGIEPQIALSYSSQAGNGRLGVGWSIAGLSSITRCRKDYASGQNLPNRAFVRQTEGIQFDSTDDFCLDGNKLLLQPNTGSYGAVNSEYRTEVDTFQKIVILSVGVTGPAHWIVYRKDGTIAEYRLHTADFRDTLRPDGTLNTRVHTEIEFPIVEVRDRAGNEMNFDWGGDGRIVEIRYTGCTNTTTCNPYDTGFKRRVQFVYDSDPLRPPGRYVNGVAVSTAFRLTNIKTWDHTLVVGGELVLDYRLEYQVSKLTNRNLLKVVTLADSGNVTLPPTIFHWRGEEVVAPQDEYEWIDATVPGYVDPLVLRPAPAVIRDVRETMLENSFVVLDVNGDGNDDIVLKRWAGAQNGVIIGTNHRKTSAIEPRDYLLLGSGHGRFKDPVPLDPEGNGQPASGSTCQQAEIIDLQNAQVVDLDANGTEELIAPMNSGCPFVTASICAISSDPCDFRLTTRWNNVNNLSEEGRMYAVLRWDPALGTLRSTPLDPISSTSWVKHRVMFADVNGDALPDLFRTSTVVPTWLERQANFAPGGTIGVTYAPSVETELLSSVAQDSSIPMASPFRPDDPISVVDEDNDGRQEFMRHGAGIYRSYSRNRDRRREWKILNEAGGTASVFEDTATSAGPGAAWNENTPNNPEAVKRVYLDLNGDGLRDFLVPVVATGEFMLRMNTGAGYTAPTRLTTDSVTLAALRPYVVAQIESDRPARSALLTTDWNGDGRDDLLLLGPPTTTAINSILMPDGKPSGYYARNDAIFVCYGQENGVGQPVPILPTENRLRLYSGELAWNMVKVAELNGDHLPELVMFVRETTLGSLRRLMVLRRKNRFLGADVIREVQDARGSLAEKIDYDTMSMGSDKRLELAQTHTPDTVGTEFEGSTALHLPCVYPAKCIARGTVVRSHVDSRSWRKLSQDFRYSGGRDDVTGRGSLGFRKVTSIDRDTGSVTDTRYSPVISHGNVSSTEANYHAYPMLLHPVSIKQKIPPNALVNSTLDRAADRPLAVLTTNTPSFFGGRPITLNSLRTKQLFLEDVGSPTQADERQRVRRDIDVSYDSLGNETGRTVSLYDVTLDVMAETLMERVSTSTIFQNSIPNWLISMPDRRITRYDTRAAPYDSCTVFPCDSKTQIVDYLFDGEGFLKDLIREPTGDVSLRLHTSFGRDAAGLVRTITVRDNTTEANATQRVTEIDYDAFGHHPRVAKNPEGHLRWFLYDQRLDRVLVETDPNNVSVYSQYDRFGRLRERRDDRGPIERFSYGNDFFRREVEGGEKRTQFFDQAGRPEAEVWTTLTGTGVAQNKYDVLGNVVESRYAGLTEPYTTVSGSAAAALGRLAGTTSFVTASARFDARGREVWRRTGSDLPITTSYNGLAETTVTHGSGPSAHQRKLYRSASGRVREILDKLVSGSSSERWLSTRYVYDALGLLGKVVDPENQVETLGYDRLGRPTYRAASATKSALTQWTHSAFSDVTRTRDGVNDITLTYDRLGRLDRRLLPNGTVLTDLTWDDQPKGRGKLSRAVGPTGHTIGYMYDNQGRPGGEVHTFGTTRLSTVRTYDANGRLSMLQYPETPTNDVPLGTRGTGMGIKFNYVNGQTSFIQDVTSGTAVTVWTANERHPLGMIQKATEHHATRTATATFGYKNDSLRLERVTGTGFMSPPNISLSYGPTGLLQSRTVQTGLVETFDHDTLRRLWRYQRIASSGSLRLAGIEYSYDDAGNITRADATQSQDSPDFPLVDYDYQYSGAFTQRLSRQVSNMGSTRELRYDAAGRQTEDQPDIQRSRFRKITYNYLNLPTRIEWMQNATTPDPDQPATTFDYDAFGNRVRKTRGQDVVVYVGGLYTRSPQQTLYLVGSEDGPLMEVRQAAGGTNRTPTFPYHDQLGSRVGTSIVGATVPSGYFPYGQRWHNGTPPTTPFSIGYTGHEHDDDLALVNMQGRIYDPSQGRFITPDPKTLPMSAGGMNPYAYALNSPVNYSDPSGLQTRMKITINTPDGPREIEVGDPVDPVTRLPNPIVVPPAPGQMTPSGIPDSGMQAQQQAEQRAQQQNNQRIAQENALRSMPAGGPGLPGVPRLGMPRTGYAYTWTGDLGRALGPVADGGTKEDAMALLQAHPSDYFPFEVLLAGTNERGAIIEGEVYDLKGATPIPWRRDPIKVIEVTDTSFTFETLPEHFDGAGALVTFSTVERDGVVYLEHTASAPNAGMCVGPFAPTFAAHAWDKQAAALRQALWGPDAMK